MGVERLVVENAGWIRNNAGYYYMNETDAEDLASETIYKCLRHADRFDNRKSFKAWVRTIMENTYKTQYVRKSLVIFSNYSEPELYIGKDSTDQRAMINDLLSIIRECKRDSRCIDCVLLYAKGYNYEEISIISDIPVGTVRSRVYHGRKMLREMMDYP